MEHLESTEEARLFVEETLDVENIAIKLDPQWEQERVDCEDEGQIIHPDYEHLNLEDMNLQAEKTAEKQFKPIVIDDRETLLRNTRKLDFYQRKVVEKGIYLARELVK